METILFFAFAEPDGSLGKSAREALAAAKELAEKVAPNAFIGAVAGGKTDPAASLLAGAGCARVLAAENPALDQARYAADAAALEAAARAAEATLVLLPGTSRAQRVLGGAAHRLGGRADTHVTELRPAEGGIEATRWHYRQRIEARFTREQRPWLVTLDPSGFAPWEAAAAEPAPEKLATPIDENALRTRVVGFKAPESGAETIRPDADLLFVAGAGWTKKQADGKPHVEEAERLILEFLRLSRASLGSSKSLVDLAGEGEAILSFLTHLHQVGQTGATPRHPKGLAACCHGEEPHTVGWRFINERRAINLDPNCGWARGKADVLYVADAFAVMAELNKILAERAGQSPRQES